METVEESHQETRQEPAEPNQVEHITLKEYLFCSIEHQTDSESWVLGIN